MAYVSVPTSLTTSTWTGLYSYLGDVNDLSYIESPTSPVAAQTFSCNMGAVDAPVDDTGHLIRARICISPAAGEDLDLVLQLENTDDSSVVATRIKAHVPDSFTDYVFNLLESEAALIHNYSGLRIVGYGRPTVGAQTISFVWSAVPSATSYVLYVGTTSMASDVHSDNVGNVLTHEVSLSGGTYFCRVAAIVGGIEQTATDEQVVNV